MTDDEKPDSGRLVIGSQKYPLNHSVISGTGLGSANPFVPPANYVPLPLAIRGLPKKDRDAFLRYRELFLKNPQTTFPGDLNPQVAEALWEIIHDELKRKKEASNTLVESSAPTPPAAEPKISAPVEALPEALLEEPFGLPLIPVQTHGVAGEDLFDSGGNNSLLNSAPAVTTSDTPVLQSESVASPAISVTTPSEITAPTEIPAILSEPAPAIKSSPAWLTGKEWVTGFEIPKVDLDRPQVPDEKKSISGPYIAYICRRKEIAKLKGSAKNQGEIEKSGISLRSVEFLDIDKIQSAEARVEVRFSLHDPIVREVVESVMQTEMQERARNFYVDVPRSEIKAQMDNNNVLKEYLKSRAAIRPNNIKVTLTAQEEQALDVLRTYLGAGALNRLANNMMIIEDDAINTGRAHPIETALHTLKIPSHRMALLEEESQSTARQMRATQGVVSKKFGKDSIIIKESEAVAMIDKLIEARLLPSPKRGRPTSDGGGGGLSATSTAARQR